MKNMTNKKKVAIILSGITLLFSFVAFIMTVIFLVKANNLVEVQMNNYSVNRKTIMWIADISESFFGSSKWLVSLAITGMVLSLLTIISIVTMWITIYFKNNKNITFHDSKIVIAIPTVTSITALVGMSVISVAINRFEDGVDTKNVSNYFEQNASNISKNREDAAKASFLYVLANKDEIASFSIASKLQMTMALTVFTTLQDEINQGNNKIINELKDFSKNNPKLYEPVKGKIKGNLIKSNGKSVAENWITAFPGYIALSNANNIEKNKFAANILENHDAFVELVSGKYPEIFKRLKVVYDKSEKFSYNAFVASASTTDPKIWNIFIEEGLFDSAGNSIREGNLEWFNKLEKQSSKFENRVLGTIAKLFKLPYTSEEEKFKSKITILEWLNTMINGINYISKNEEIEIQNNFKNLSGHNILETPKDIYMPIANNDGTFKIIKSADKKIGEVGDNTYDIKFSMMKYILADLSKTKNGIIENLTKRQKSICPISFIENIINSKGLEEMTNQYPKENKYFNDKKEYSYKDEIKNIVNNLNNFIK